MIYAQRVKSPLKGGVDVELGEKTLLVGKNGAGKTAILQALKLGTRSYVDDQEGKDGVTTTAVIARLFPPGAELRSDVMMSDGAKFSWSSSAKGRGFAKPKLVAPYRVSFPFQTLKTLLSGDDKKVRGWLENHVGGTLSEEELLGLLPPNQHAVAGEALTRFPKSRSPVDLANDLKSEARNMRAAATRQEKTIDVLVEGVPLPLSPDDEKELRARMAELWDAAHTSNGVSEEQRDKLTKTIHQMAAQLDAMTTQIAQLPEATEEQRASSRLVVAGHSLSKSHLETFGDDFCQVCQRAEASIQPVFEQWSGLMGTIEASASRSRLQAQYDSGKRQVEQLVAQFKQIEVVDFTGLMNEHGLLSARLGAHDSSKRAWRQAEALRREVQSDRVAATAFADLGKTWLTEGTLLLEQRQSSFENKVTKWIAGGEEFAVDLKAGRVGIRRGDEVHTSLSGGELSKVLLAVLSAEEEERSSTPSILEPEDRGWDPDTLVDVMTALSGAPDQVILMSTVLPSRAPEGWTILHVG